MLKPASRNDQQNSRKRMGGQSVEAGIVAHKQPGQGGGQHTGQDRQGHAADGHQQGAFPQEVFSSLWCCAP